MTTRDRRLQIRIEPTDEVVSNTLVTSLREIFQDNDAVIVADGQSAHGLPENSFMKTPLMVLA